MLNRVSKKKFLEELRYNRVWVHMANVSDPVFDRPCTAYMSDNYLQGYIIYEDGEIAALHSLEKEQGDKLVHEANARGGRWLTCYDNGFLVGFYERCGMTVTERSKNYGGDHLPDGVRMEWTQKA